MSIQISWHNIKNWTLENRDPEPQYFFASYDENPKIFTHQNEQYAVIDFNPITDKDASVPMREPLSGPDTFMLLIKYDDNSFAPVGEIKSFSDNASFEEIMRSPHNSGFTTEETAIGEKIRSRMYSSTNPVGLPMEQRESRYFATNIGVHSTKNQKGFLVIEVPSCMDQLDLSKVSREHRQSEINYQRSLAKDELLDSKGGLYGAPGAKIEHIKFHCLRDKIPFRLKLYDTPNLSSQTLNDRQEAGFFNDKNVYQLTREKTSAPSNQYDSGKRFSLQAFAKFLNDRSQDNQSFPHGERACQQIREMYASRKECDSPSP